MANVPLPSRIEFVPQGPHHDRVEIEPCFPGYGVTLGNALRRVLLSSLPGSAITGFKVEDVFHEFSSIPHVKEDVVELMLNLKRVRLKSFSAEPITLSLSAKGEKVVRAGDIAPNAQVQVANPNQVIATLTDKSAVLEMELVVEQGRGYVPVEQREKERPPIGLIMLDALYTPVRNVGFEIELTRVGQVTNYEKLLLDLETDGTISPRSALGYAAQILQEHVSLFTGFYQPEEQVLEESAAVEPEVKPKRGRKSAATAE